MPAIALVRDKYSYDYPAAANPRTLARDGEPDATTAVSQRETLTVFVAGDVMTGRGIDQALSHPSDPALHEPFVRDARDYVALAEQRHGDIGAPLGDHELWGAAVRVWNARSPDARIVNLETSITTSDEPWPGKGIHYRMHPGNVGCLVAAGLDCCVLANNHVLDWGYGGLDETLATLARAGIASCGAGHDLAQASAPARLPLRPGRRLLVYALADASSGVPASWAATPNRPGVNRVDIERPGAAERVAQDVAAGRRPGDIVVVSIHWGGNWGWSIPESQRRFARALIDAGGADLVHGHSSHHVKRVECYRGRPVLFGAGDFVNDYEGIRGHERFRPWISTMYFATFDGATGRFDHLDAVPLRMQRFRLHRAADDDLRWVAERLSDRVSASDLGRHNLRVVTAG